MSKFSEIRFLRIASGELDKKQISDALNVCVKKLKNVNKTIKKCDIYVNVVETKDKSKFGYSYAWVRNVQVYYALIGKNFDGTDRIKIIDDENWVKPEGDMDDEIDECGDDWGKMADVEQKYERPKIEIKEDPLVIPPGTKYSKAQIEILKEKKGDDFGGTIGFLEITPMYVTINPDEEKTNKLYSKDVKGWVTEEMLHNFFDKFVPNIDQAVKTKQNTSDPCIKINLDKRGYSSVQISFSSTNKNIAYFLVKLLKKISLRNPETNEEETIIFSQSRSKEIIEMYKNSKSAGI
jgi:hypothetical protein